MVHSTTPVKNSKGSPKTRAAPGQQPGRQFPPLRRDIQQQRCHRSCKQKATGRPDTWWQAPTHPPAAPPPARGSKGQRTQPVRKPHLAPLALRPLQRVPHQRQPQRRSPGHTEGVQQPRRPGSEHPGCTAQPPVGTAHPHERDNIEQLAPPQTIRQPAPGRAASQRHQNRTGQNQGNQREVGAQFLPDKVSKGAS
jgi:hypothetical protein